MTVVKRIVRGAVGAALSLLLWGAAHGSAGAVPVTGSLDDVSVEGGRVEAVLTAPALPSGQPIDPDSVRVQIGGVGATASARLAGEATRAERAAVLLVDVSGSMDGDGIAFAQSAGNAFLDAVPADVSVGIVTFNDVTQVLLAPTQDRQSARDVLGGLDASRETALYDGVAAALATLGSQGDRTLIVLSDGGDTVSSSTLDEALAALRASGARIHVIGFRTDDSQDAVLEQMAEAGGGRVSSGSEPAALAEAFTETAAVLSSQVVVTAEVPPQIGGDVELHVAASAGGDEVTGTALVHLPAPAAPLPEPAAAADAASSGSVVVGPKLFASPVPVAALVFLSILVLALLVLAPTLESSGKRRTRELDLYTVQGRRVRARQKLTGASGRQFGQAVLDVSQRMVKRRGIEQEMALRLDQADLPFRPHEWLVLRLAGALAVVAVVVVMGAGPLGGLLGLLIGWLASGVFRRVRAARRLKRFATQLPDALALVASSLQTGFSLPQALDAVARDSSPPLSVEIGRAIAEARLGAEAEDALDRVSERMENEDMRWAVMAMRIQRQVGGNLAETLRCTVATVRERAALRRHVRALSAEGRLSAYILIALPLLIAVFMYTTNRSYISLLWTSVVGWLMLGVVAVGMVVGWIWMSKVVKVEV